MSLIMLSGPALEPVSLADAKAFLRVDDVVEDTLIASLVSTSRAHIETALGLGLLTQSWRLTIDAWPEMRVLEVPIAPLRSLVSIRAVTAGATARELDLSGFMIEQGPRPARIGLRPGIVLPATQLIAGISVDMLIGFGDRPADVPAPIRHALLLLVAHWYQNREPALVGHEVTRIPHTVSDLLQPWRQVRL